MSIGIGNEQAKAWAEGYRMGVADERTSEANIGIAGFNAKVEPDRQNPYGTPQLKQEQVEPVAWFREENGEKIYYETKAWDDCLALYATPQTKEWVSLTNEQIVDLVIKNAGFPTKLAEAIEAKLKEKNAL